MKTLVSALTYTQKHHTKIIYNLYDKTVCIFGHFWVSLCIYICRRNANLADSDILCICEHLQLISLDVAKVDSGGKSDMLYLFATFPR